MNKLRESASSSTLPQSLNFRVLFEAAPGLYLVLTPDFKIVAASDAYLRATMTKREEILGRGIFEVFPDNPDDPAATGVRNLTASLERVLRNGVSDAMAVQKYDIRRPESEGGGFEERYWSPVNSPVFGAKNDVACIIHRVEDVTEFVRLKERGIEQEKLTQELRQAEERMRSVVDHVIDGIITIDEHGTVESYNPAAERIFGYSAQEVVGKNVKMLMPAPFHHEHDGYLANYLRSGEAKIIGIGREVVGRRKNGSTFPMDLAVSEFHLGKVRYFTGIVRDISQRKRAETELLKTAQELARSNLDLEQFAYVASHDLQEPLRAVSGCVQVLKKRYQGQLDDRANELIAHTVDGVSRMQSLINGLLSYSRVGTQGKAFEPCHCKAILEQALANLEAAITEAGAVVTHDQLPVVRADAAQLTQLVQNLVSNAIKFRGKEPPRIHVAVRQDEGKWVFSVKDNGIGMQPEYFERIFVIFQRLHTRTEYPGTGIGLALCKKIVERHGGRIFVESEPGQGSTFFFTLPDRGASA